MALAKILLCMDTDPQPSVFDSVVALDAGAEQLLRHGGVTPADVKSLIHGLMFTRGGNQLHHAAAIIGGSDVVAGEQLLHAAKQAFSGLCASRLCSTAMGQTRLRQPQSSVPAATCPWVPKP